MPGVPIYALGDGHFLVDDSQVDYNALREQAELERAFNRLLTPEENEQEPVTFAPGTLYLQVLSVSNHIWVAVCGLTNGNSGEILYRQALDSGEWVSEGSLISTNDDLNSVMLTVGDRTNSLFLSCRSPAAYDALPLSWQLDNFGFTGVPRDGDFDQDGVGNLQEYLNGSDPNNCVFSVNFDHLRTSAPSVLASSLSDLEELL